MMKKITLLVAILGLNFQLALSQWDDIKPVSSMFYPNLTFSDNGTGYLAYCSYSSGQIQMNVKKWENNAWSTLPSTLISPQAQNLPEYTKVISIGAGDSIIVCSAGFTGSSTSGDECGEVKLFDGSNWSIVGGGQPFHRTLDYGDVSCVYNPHDKAIYYIASGSGGLKIQRSFPPYSFWQGFSDPQMSTPFPYHTESDIVNNTLYTSYVGGANAIFKYDFNTNTSSTIAFPSVLPPITSYRYKKYDIKVNPVNNDIYLAYYVHNTSTFVYKYDGAWTLIGDTTSLSSPKAGEYPVLEFDNNNVLHLGYGDINSTNNTNIDKFVGGQWHLVGGQHTNGGAGRDLSFGFNNNNTPFVNGRYLLDTLTACVTTATLNDTMCAGDSYTSPSGKTWTTAGTYMDTILNAAACDSVITINLATNTVQPVTLTQTTHCVSFTTSTYFSIHVNNSEAGVSYSLRDSASGNQWLVGDIMGNGGAISFDTTYANVSRTFEVKAIKGNCEFSAGYIRVNKKISTMSWQTVKSCTGSYTSPTSGKVWTTTGTYHDTLAMPNQYGCDSLIEYYVTVGTNSTGTITETVCDEYYAPSGKYLYTTGTHLDTIRNASSCDSVITINLTVNMSTFNSVSTTVCDSYTGPSGKIYSTTGFYQDTVANTAGCDSITSVHLTVIPQNYSVTQVADTLEASYTGGSTIQWLDCDNGYAVIPGATGYKFNPTTSGNYALEMRWLNCIDTSACYNVSYTNIEEHNTLTLSVYPNPVNDILNVEGVNLDQVMVKVLDISGKEIKVIKTNNSINTQHLVRGAYVLIIQSDKGITQTKFTKQ